LPSFETKFVQGEEAYLKVRRRTLGGFGPKLGDFGPDDEIVNRFLEVIVKKSIAAEAKSTYCQRVSPTTCERQKQ
jgi:hypothetical protein